MSFISVVYNAVPKTRNIYDAMKLPIACTVSPQLSIPLSRIQFPRKGIERCAYCKGYLSPYCNLFIEDSN